MPWVEGCISRPMAFFDFSPALSEAVASASMDPLAYLNDLGSRPIRLGLAPLRRLLARMRHPENQYVHILVGGTNGKGSIAAMASAILTAGGYRTGLYTSPHLVDVRERIRVNGCMISQEDLRAHIETVRGHLRGELTYFELLTAVAFLHFHRQRVDVAVLEVGMGGRLDATNVVRPAVSVISNIALDHCQYLGNSIGRIAGEKSGIIKRGGCCLTAVRQKEALNRIRATCRDKRARFFCLGDQIRLRRQAGGCFSLHMPGRRYEGLRSALMGGHQAVNAALAVGAVTLLAEKGLIVDEAAIRRGLQETRWEGRLETVRQRPLVLVDGAHNPAGIASLRAALKEFFSGRRLTVIFGVLDDKDYRRMLGKLTPLAEQLILTRPDSDRGLSPAALLPVARRYHRCVSVVEQPREALRRALAAAGRDDLICVTGSLYLVGAVKRFVAEG